MATGQTALRVLPVLSACLALSPSVARAAERDPGTADISWVRLEGAEACPPASEIRAEVSRRLGRELVTIPDGRSIEVVIKGGTLAWSAQIRTRGPDGASLSVRDLSSSAATCQPIASAATLVIALAIDPEAALLPQAAPAPPQAEEPSPPAEAPAKPPAAPAARPPAKLQPSVPAPREAAPPHVSTSVTLRGAATLGLLPGIAPGVAWAAEWAVTPRWTIATGALWLPERPAADPTFSFGLTVGWVGACAEVLRLRSIALGACGHLLAGAIHAVIASNPSVSPTDPGARGWASLGAGARFSAAVVGPLHLGAGLDLTAPLTRYSFQLQGSNRTAFAQAPVGGVLFGGAGVTF